jgi:methyl-accepting chemotaxis protein
MKRFSLNKKIWIVIAILIAGALGIATVGITRMAEIEGSLEHIAKVYVPRKQSALEIQSTLQGMAVYERNILLSKDASEREKDAAEFTKRKDRMNDYIEQAIKIAAEEDKIILAQLNTKYQTYLSMSERAQVLAMDGYANEAFDIIGNQGRDLRYEIDRITNDLVISSGRRMDERVAKAESDYIVAAWTMIGTSLFAILLGVFIAIVILRSVSKAINNVISQLTSNSTQVSSAAKQIAGSSMELSQTTTEQAASLEETASAIEQLSAMTKRNAESARNSTIVSKDSNHSALRGKKVVSEMIQAMQEIDQANARIMEQVNQSNQQMSEIVKVISEIGSKTKVINEIVFQTKLLSFNASVEAARAGEHGKGFAVVAEEVGNLAQMSGNAAREISEMLETSIQKVEAIASGTKTRVETLVTEGKAKVAVGANVAKECGAVLDEIVTNVSSVSQMIGEIATASDEQARGIEEITNAMNQLDQVTQQNAAVSEEAASAAEHLAGQAETLGHAVTVLVATIKGESHEATSFVRPIAEVSSAEGAKTKSANVLRFQNRKSIGRQVPESRGQPMEKGKAVAGSDVVPAENDPRFVDI